MKRCVITATRNGMSMFQLETLKKILAEEKPDVLHHGDCVGGDAQADAAAQELGIERSAHPGNIDSLRAFCKAETVEEPTKMLYRNRFMVDLLRGDNDFLIACPQRDYDHGGGTWYTYNYGRRCGVRTILILPTGFSVTTPAKTWT